MKELSEKDLLVLYDLLLEYQEYLSLELDKVDGGSKK